MYASFSSQLPQSLSDDLESHARNQLRAGRAEAEKLGAERLQIALLRGLPFEAVVQFARSKQAGLIVMGTHGRSALKRVLSGSVAERVGHPDCPVLTVRTLELRAELRDTARRASPRRSLCAAPAERADRRTPRA